MLIAESLDYSLMKLHNTIDLVVEGQLALTPLGSTLNAALEHTGIELSTK